MLSCTTAHRLKHSVVDLQELMSDAERFRSSKERFSGPPERLTITHI